MKKVKVLMTVAAIFGLATITMAQVPNYVPTTGLVGWWPFNGNANDESGNGNNGIVNGANLVADRNGVANSAYSFNGSSNSIDIGNPTEFTIQPISYTQSVWLKLNDFPTTNVVYPIISKRHQNNGNDWATARIQNNGKCYFYADDAFYMTPTPAISPSISLSNWYHFTFVKEVNFYKIYLNSIPIDSVYDNHLMGGSTDNILIGAQLAWSSYFKGVLDDVGIWNRVLTQQEITALYNGCGGSSLITQPTNQSVNPTNTAQFSVSSTPGSLFQWQTDLGLGFQNVSNAGQYSGANTDTLFVSNVSGFNNNQQFRCIVNSGNCADTSEIAVLTVSTLGIEEIMNQPILTLYPNPTQSSFEIQTNLVYTKLQIRDMQGRIVKTENAGKTIHIASVQKGTYLVELLDETSRVIAAQKMIKE